jgi:hypothetical protein
MKRKFRLSAFLYIAIIVSLGAGLRERFNLVAALSEVSALQERSRQLAVFQAAFLKYVNRAELGRPFLVADSGVGLASEKGFDLEPRTVLVNPRGSAVDIIPRYGTPTLVAIAEEQVVLLEFGELSPEAQDFLRSSSRSWVQDDAALLGKRFPDPVSEAGKWARPPHGRPKKERARSVREPTWWAAG